METNRIAAIGVFATIAMMLLLTGTVSANGELSVTNLVISPQPVIAGQNFTVSFQLYDSYGNLQNVNLGLSGNYPILNYSPSGTQLISSISQGLYGGATGGFFTYHFSVPKNVQSGTYTIYVTSTYLITTTSSGVTTTAAASSSSPISFYISGSPNIVVTATPATSIVPGSQSNIEINAFNSGTASATNVNVTLVNTKNFTVAGSPLFNLGTVSAGTTASATAVLEANSTLQQGQNYIPVKLQYQTQYGANVSKIVNVPVSVIVDSPNLVPSIIAAQPQTLYAGSNQTLTVSIQNVGLGVAKNVTAQFISTSNMTVGSSASSVFIGTIQAGASFTQSVFISASKFANQTHYRLPVALKYSNANYQSNISRTLYLNITLQRSAIYNITNVSSTSLLPGATYAPITFRIKNIGAQTAQQITLSLQSIYPIAPASPNVFLKQLAPGQSANVTFYVNVDAQGNSGSYPVTLYEQWTQPNGATSQQYSSSQNYYAQVGGTRQSGGGTDATTYIIIGIVIIVVAGYILWKKVPQAANLFKAIAPKGGAQKKEKGSH